MGEVDVALGISWRTPHAVNERSIDALLERFEVDGGDPCVTWTPEGHGLTISVTWDAVMPSEGLEYEEGLDQARRLAERHFASAGLEGRLLRADVMTDEGQATWLADG